MSGNSWGVYGCSDWLRIQCGFSPCLSTGEYFDSTAWLVSLYRASGPAIALRKLYDRYKRAVPAEYNESESRGRGS